MSRTKAKLIKLAQDMEYFYRVLATELLNKYKHIKGTRDQSEV